jgi:osmotically-inducible protein OsmY
MTMAGSAALLIVPTRDAARETYAVESTAAILRESLEDLRLAERIERALLASGYGALRNIDVNVHARTVILEGQVPSYYLKQVAQATALAVPGTMQVVNALDVSRPR